MAGPRALYLGQKPVGEAAWRLLRESGLDVAAVCSNQGEDRVWWQSNAVFVSAGDLPFVDNAERNEDRLCRLVAEHQIDLILCVQHPWVLSPELLALVGGNALNLHSARLPEYGGHNAVNHAILNGDERFGCTLHWMASEVDRGPAALEASFELEAGDTALSLYAKAHHAALALFAELLARLEAGAEIPRRPLRPGGAFHPRNSIDGLREASLAEPAELERKARAFWFPPFEPAYVVVEGKKVHLVPEGADPRLDPRAALSQAIDAARVRVAPALA